MHNSKENSKTAISLRGRYSASCMHNSKENSKMLCTPMVFGLTTILDVIRKKIARKGAIGMLAIKLRELA